MQRRPTYAEVDLGAITGNIRAIRDRVGPYVKIMPAVKADGYGHGAVQVSRACLRGSADALCVSSVEEGIELREAGIDAPILILGCCVPAAAEDIVRHDLTSTLCDWHFADALVESARRQYKSVSVHIEIDTGMGRVGAQPVDAVDFVLKAADMPGLHLAGVYTHFPSSDEEDNSFTLQQIDTFKRILKSLEDRGLRIPIAHASNSGGILAFPQADFDAVRPGIMIYGHYPSQEVVRSIPICEALTLKTRIVFLKESEAGATVSYGRTFVLKRRSKIATLPIGYADGFSRMLSNQGEACVRGVRVPVIGRICMDQCMIDVTEVPGVDLDDEVILYGGGCDYLSVSTIAEKIGTIPYELLCAISKRVPRVYVNG